MRASYTADARKGLRLSEISKFGDYQAIDLSKHENKSSQTFSEDDLCVIGVPSYGGRVPSVVLERMNEFQSNNAKAILVVSYGNRAYDDTLKELTDFIETKHFDCVAAITAVAEHSIMHQFASGRPDDSDKKELTLFAKKIQNKLNDRVSCKKLNVPGNYPYREYKGIPLKPKAGKKCTNCGLCAKECPVGAIPLDSPQKTNKELCITCMRCITVCPHNARKVNSFMVKIASKKMEATCSERKKNELFI